MKSLYSLTALRSQGKTHETAVVECVDDLISESDAGCDAAVQTTSWSEVHCHGGIACDGNDANECMWAVDGASLPRWKLPGALFDSLNNDLGFAPH